MNHKNLRPQNQKIVLAEHPSGLPTADTFRTNDNDIPKPKSNEVLIKSIYVSVDLECAGL